MSRRPAQSGSLFVVVVVVVVVVEPPLEFDIETLPLREEVRQREHRHDAEVRRARA
jgi:hypothetical protein